MRRSGPPFATPALLALSLLASGLPARSQTSPEAFFGFRMGADRKLARWDKLVEYYQLLEKQGGGRLKVINMGPTTEGNPFLLVVITSRENMGRLDRLREVNARLSDPRGLKEADVRRLVDEGKAVVCQSMSLHASEVGGTQMAPELAHDLLSRTDAETKRILDNVIFLMIPSFNPDGEIMVADWYQKTLGTEYEGSNLPWLYHKYTGHDNNRDAFMTNTVESQYMAKILFREWAPEAYLDHHQMGSYGARIYVPPYADPVRPFADPLLWREHSWYGAHIAYKEEEASLSGVINSAQYSGWGHFGFHWITPFHNIAGMLTEAASAKLATPLFIQPDQLEGNARNFPAYEEQTTFPNPWPGGWWRLRDIVDRQKVSAWALLDLAARNKETVLYNAYLKASRQTVRGAEGKPAAFVIPATQHDPLTMVKLVNKLREQGVEVARARTAFTVASGMSYPAGSYTVSLAQPKMGLIHYLLGRTFYPDNTFTRDRNGNPTRPYDMATDTMAEFMGVRVDPVEGPFKADLQVLTADVKTIGKVASGQVHVLDGRLNDSFRAVNLLLEKGVPVRRVDKASAGLRPGDFLVGDATANVLNDVAARTGVDFAALTPGAVPAAHEVRRPRVGMYQRYWGGNMDEGWTRLLLEQFAFPYTTLKDAEIKKGGLEAAFDVIILPDDSTAMLTGEPGTGGRRRPQDAVPPEYRSGFGKEGVEALKAFVQKGGTLVTLAGATAFAIEKFELPIRNVLLDKPGKDFFCPGSTLRASFDNANPLAYGMPAEGLVVFLNGNAAFDLVPGDHSERFNVLARYAERDVLQSGWLVGEPLLARHAAMVSAQVGKGQVVLVGFRTQHRAQTHGTYKLLFNALLR
jgi:hypothetical protein